MSTGTKYVQVTWTAGHEFVQVGACATTEQIIKAALPILCLDGLPGAYVMFASLCNGSLKRLAATDVPTQADFWIERVSSSPGSVVGDVTVPDRNCASCRYMGRGSGRTGSTVLRCFRYPQAIEVRDRHWCGEWAAKEGM